MLDTNGDYQWQVFPLLQNKNTVELWAVFKTFAHFKCYKDLFGFCQEMLANICNGIRLRKLCDMQKFYIRVERTEKPGRGQAFYVDLCKTKLDLLLIVFN